MRQEETQETYVVHSLRADGSKEYAQDAGDVSPPLRAMGHNESWQNGGGQVAIAYQTSGNCGAWETGDHVGALDTMTDPNSHVLAIQAGATRENPESGPDGVGVQEGIAYTLEARSEVQSVYTLAIRGRGDSHDLEHRKDGTANAILTPNGGRGGIGVGAVAYNITPSQSNKDYNARPSQRSQAITTDGNRPSARGGDVIAEAFAVRRLTPLECERLQGMPDNYSLITYRGKPIADGPRYKMIGNSWAVPVVRWIGERIDLVASEMKEASAA